MFNKRDALVGYIGMLGAVALLSGAGCSSSNDNSGAGGTFGTAGSVSVSLTGAGEVPPTTSTGTADLMVSWDPVMRMVSVSGSFTGLSADATNAHLHGPATATTMLGPVIFGLTVTKGTPGTSGTVSGSKNLGFNDWVAFMGGMTYLNIHTTTNPNGEIRAQVLPTATP
jgi:hypothetical protein